MSGKKNNLGAPTVRSKGAASKQQCARHYVTEMEKEIEHRKNTIVGYIESERAEKDHRWLATLKERAGIVEKEETKKSINPLKASKRMK